METYGVYEAYAQGEPKYLTAYAEDIIGAITPGSIYLGGADSGRFLVMAFSQVPAQENPFFTVSQNALTDPAYMDYLRQIYDEKINLPSIDEWKAGNILKGRAFTDFLRQLIAGKQPKFSDQRTEAEGRRTEGKLKSRAGARMVDRHSKNQSRLLEINSKLSHLLFAENPDREFYVEDSYRIGWMSPSLEPHGLILRLPHRPTAWLSNEVVQRDREYWTRYIAPMIGNWLTPDTSVSEVCDFAERVFGRKDLAGFKGDPKFVGNEYCCQMFSKLRTAIAIVYMQYVFPDNLAANAKNNVVEQQRMAEAADFAFRQALALCPRSPEAIYRYISLLVNQNRITEALAIVRMAQKLEPANRQLENLRTELERINKQNQPGAAPSTGSSRRVQSPYLLADPGTNQMTLTTNRFYFRLVSDDPSQPADLLPDPRNPDHKLRVLKAILMDETAVAEANVSKDPITGQLRINLELTESGAERFAQITAANVHRQLALVFDGKILTAPFVNEPITGGRIAIAGNWNEEETRALVKALNRSEAPAVR